VQGLAIAMSLPESPREDHGQGRHLRLVPTWSDPGS
jgi:hypothetical protein